MASARTAGTGTDNFVEQIAVILEADGMARVAGRIFGLLLVSAEPRSLDELAEKLGVSKASISINVRLLEEKGVVERIGRQGDRRDYYRTAEDMFERMLEQRMAKVRRLQQSIEFACKACLRENHVVRSRLENLDLAYNHLLDVTQRALDEWRVRRNKRGTTHTARSR